MKKKNDFAIAATVVGLLFGAGCAICFLTKSEIGFLICGYVAVICFAAAVFRGAKFRRL